MGYSLVICFNLIGSYASKSLPKYIKPLVKSIYNHFAHSSLRVAKWLQLQVQMNLKLFKILVLSRWTSHFEVIARLLDRWDNLLQYFEFFSGDDDEIYYISKKLKKPCTKVIFRGYS